MFNPNEHMMKLKGKDYLQVAWRLVWFREDHPAWGLATEIQEHGDDWAVFKATITDDAGRTISTGHGSESVKDFGDYLEKAETKAVGRALAMLGYGTQFAADELDEGERIVDSPIDRTPSEKKPTANTKNAPGGPCADCGKLIDGVKIGGKYLDGPTVGTRTWAKYGRPLCYECSKKAQALMEGTQDE